MVFFPGLDWIQSPWGLFPTVALHWLHRRVLSVLERLNMCHSCDCMHQTSQSAFSVTGICKDKKSECFISAAASVLFWSFAQSVFKTLHLMPVAACWCHHFPPSMNRCINILYHKEILIYFLSPSTWWDIDGRNLGLLCQQSWICHSGCCTKAVSSQICILPISTMMNKPHILYIKPS